MIGKWSGTPLRTFLERIGADTTAQLCRLRMRRRLLRGHGHADRAASADASWRSSLSDEILPRKYGYPFKIRVPTKLGFKNPKFVTTIYVTNHAAARLLDRSRLQLVQRDLSMRRAPSNAPIAVMAKAPRPGRVKTRLVPPLTAHEAAALSAAFLRDVTENIREAGSAAPIRGYRRLCAGGAARRCSTASAPRHAAGAGRRFAIDVPPGVHGFGRSSAACGDVAAGDGAMARRAW